MNKITLYLNDEIGNSLDRIAQSKAYYKYPKYQAYGLIIADLIRSLPLYCCCCGGIR